jgi:hypothetical protein
LCAVQPPEQIVHVSPSLSMTSNVAQTSHGSRTRSRTTPSDAPGAWVRRREPLSLAAQPVTSHHLQLHAHRRQWPSRCGCPRKAQGWSSSPGPCRACSTGSYCWAPPHSSRVAANRSRRHCGLREHARAPGAHIHAQPEEEMRATMHTYTHSQRKRCGQPCTHAVSTRAQSRPPANCQSHVVAACLCGALTSSQVHVWRTHVKSSAWGGALTSSQVHGVAH